MRDFPQFKGGGHGPSGSMVNTPMGHCKRINYMSCVYYTTNTKLLINYVYNRIYRSARGTKDAVCLSIYLSKIIV